VWHRKGGGRGETKKEKCIIGRRKLNVFGKTGKGEGSEDGKKWSEVARSSRNKSKKLFGGERPDIKVMSWGLGAKKGWLGEKEGKKERHRNQSK